MSTIVSAPSTLPPVNCAPWCEDGDGHPNAWHPRDQYCTSDEVRTSLTREAPIEGVEEGSKMLDYMTAYLVHDRFEAEPHLQLARNDLATVTMTLAEAEDYLRRALDLVQRARA